MPSRSWIEQARSRPFPPNPRERLPELPAALAPAQIRDQPRTTPKRTNTTSVSTSVRTLVDRSIPTLHNHFLTFVDAATRHLSILFLQNRRQVTTVLPSFISSLHARGLSPHTLRTDNEMEFCSTIAKSIYNQAGIHHIKITPYQPQEHSITERINKTLLNAARPALNHSSPPTAYWEDAVRDSAFEYNLMLHKAVENSPHALFHKRKPKIPQIIAFDKPRIIPIHAPEQKLQARALQVRYSYGISEQLVRVQDIYTGSYRTARAADFVPYHRTMDPTAITPHAFCIVVQCAWQAANTVRRSNKKKKTATETTTADGTRYGAFDTPFPFMWACGPQ